MEKKARKKKGPAPKDGVRRPTHKRRKTMERGSSPSHLYVDDEEEIQYGPAFTLDIPDRERADNLFRAVSRMYYRQKDTHPSGTMVYVHADYDTRRYPSLDMLLSPLRKRCALDDWSPREIALFEAGICKFGKNFHGIQKIIQSKTTNEIVEFYYTCFKKSEHYKIWKKNKNAAYQMGADDNMHSSSDETPGLRASVESEEKTPALDSKTQDRTPTTNKSRGDAMDIEQDTGDINEAEEALSEGQPEEEVEVEKESKSKKRGSKRGAKKGASRRR